MKYFNLAVGLLIGLGVAAWAQGATPPSHDAPPHAAAPTQRWATDAPLRDGMSRIHTALDELRQYEMGHMPQDMALQRVVIIEEAIHDIFANCKLAPDADAALHSILVPLLNGATALRSNPHDLAAVAAMRTAVADYPSHFDDPQWPAITVKAGAEHNSR